MGWTKRQYIEQAFDKIGLADYVFDLQPQQIESAMRQLDAMLALWNSKSIRIGYPLPWSPQQSDLDADTVITDQAAEAIYLNLAVRLADGIGRQISPELRATAQFSYDALVQLSASRNRRQYQFPATLPRGAGQKSYGQSYYTFVNPPIAPLELGPDGIIEPVIPTNTSINDAQGDQ